MVAESAEQFVKAGDHLAGNAPYRLVMPNHVRLLRRGKNKGPPAIVGQPRIFDQPYTTRVERRR